MLRGLAFDCNFLSRTLPKPCEPQIHRGVTGNTYFNEEGGGVVGARRMSGSAAIRKRFHGKVDDHDCRARRKKD